MPPPKKGKNSKKGKEEESPKKKHSKKKEDSIDESDNSEPPEELEPVKKGKSKEQKNVKLEVVNKNAGGKDWESPPDHYTFAKKTNFLVYKESVVAAWGKDGIRKLNKRDITNCENKGWDVDPLDEDKAKKKMDKLK